MGGHEGEAIVVSVGVGVCGLQARLFSDFALYTLAFVLQLRKDKLQSGYPKGVQLTSAKHYLFS
jgi:hypothetical protein